MLEHYNEAPFAMIGHNEATELNLRGWELRALEAFLNTLSAPITADEKWLQPPEKGIGSNLDGEQHGN